MIKVKTMAKIAVIKAVAQRLKTELKETSKNVHYVKSR